MGFDRVTAIVLALYFGLSEACLSDIGSLLALFPTPAPQMAAIRNDLCSGANDSFLISKYILQYRVEIVSSLALRCRPHSSCSQLIQSCQKWQIWRQTISQQQKSDLQRDST